MSLLGHAALAALGGVLVATALVRLWGAWRARRGQRISAGPDHAYGAIDRLQEAGIGGLYGADRGLTSGADIGRMVGSAIGFAVDVVVQLLIEIAEDALGRGNSLRPPFGMFRWIYGLIGMAIGALLGAALGGVTGSAHGLLTGRAAPAPPPLRPPRRLSQPSPTYGGWR